MYHEYYGLSADPFRLTPDSQSLYLHASFKKALSYFQYALHKGEGIVLVTGTPGSGKTALVNKVLREHDDYSLIFTTIDCNSFSGLELLHQFAAGLSVRAETDSLGDTLATISSQLNRLRDQNKRAILVLDEAHLLTEDALEKIHLMSNLQVAGQPLVQMFLVGQPALKQRVLSPAHEQLHQRIIATCNIASLTNAETQGYVLHQLLSAHWNDNPGIADSVFTAIHSASLGVPRWINLICGRMMVHAVAHDKHLIELEDICEVLNDLLSEDLLPQQVRLSNKRPH